VVEREERELVDVFAVDEVENAPDEELASAITTTSTVFSIQSTK